MKVSFLLDFLVPNFKCPHWTYLKEFLFKWVSTYWPHSFHIRDLNGSAWISAVWGSECHQFAAILQNRASGRPNPQETDKCARSWRIPGKRGQIRCQRLPSLRLQQAFQEKVWMRGQGWIKSRLPVFFRTDSFRTRTDSQTDSEIFTFDRQFWTKKMQKICAEVLPHQFDSIGICDWNLQFNWP